MRMSNIVDSGESIVTMPWLVQSTRGLLSLLLLGISATGAKGRVYPATEAHAPSCGPERDSCQRIRFVVQGDGTAVKLKLVHTHASQHPKVLAVTNGHAAREVNSSDHTMHLRPGINTILYTFSAPVSISELHIAQQNGENGAGFVTYEAEDATCNGTVIGPCWATELANKTEIASEASQRKACQLTKVGHFVELTLTKPGNVAEVRFSIPDGKQATVEVTAGGEPAFSLSLTSNYSWNYGWQISPSSRDPSKGYAHKFYDEVTAALVPLESHRTLPAGTKVLCLVLHTLY
jgi:hypothetical protein